jgi:hypothetical protein
VEWMLVAIGLTFMMCSYVSLHISLRGGYGGTSPVHLMLIMRDDRRVAACPTSVSACARAAFRGCQRAKTRVSDAVPDRPRVHAPPFLGGRRAAPAIMQP